LCWCLKYVFLFSSSARPNSSKMSSKIFFMYWSYKNMGCVILTVCHTPAFWLCNETQWVTQIFSIPVVCAYVTSEMKSDFIHQEKKLRVKYTIVNILKYQL
jgi:hypothetical protein